MRVILRFYFIDTRLKIVFEILSLEEPDVTAQCFLHRLVKTKSIDTGLSVLTLNSTSVFSKKNVNSNIYMH